MQRNYSGDMRTKSELANRPGIKGRQLAAILFSNLVVDVIDRQINDRICRQFGDAT